MSPLTTTSTSPFSTYLSFALVLWLRSPILLFSFTIPNFSFPRCSLSTANHRSGSYAKLCWCIIYVRFSLSEHWTLFLPTRCSYLRPFGVVLWEFLLGLWIQLLPNDIFSTDSTTRFSAPRWVTRSTMKSFAAMFILAFPVVPFVQCKLTSPTTPFSLSSFHPPFSWPPPVVSSPPLFTKRVGAEGFRSPRKQIANLTPNTRFFCFFTTLNRKEPKFYSQLLFLIFRYLLEAVSLMILVDAVTDPWYARWRRLCC